MLWSVLLSEWWLLTVGRAPAEDADKCYQRVSRMSRRYDAPLLLHYPSLPSPSVSSPSVTEHRRPDRPVCRVPYVGRCHN